MRCLYIRLISAKNFLRLPLQRLSFAEYIRLSLFNSVNARLCRYYWPLHLPLPRSRSHLYLSRSRRRYRNSLIQVFDFIFQKSCIDARQASTIEPWEGQMRSGLLYVDITNRLSEASLRASLLRDPCCRSLLNLLIRPHWILAHMHCTAVRQLQLMPANVQFPFALGAVARIGQ